MHNVLGFITLLLACFPILAQTAKAKLKANQAYTDDMWVASASPALPKGVTHHFRSESIKREVVYCLDLPPGYEKYTERRYPVIYHLHGAGGNEMRSVYWANLLPEGILAGKPTAYTHLEQVRQYEDLRGWPVLSVDGYDVYVDVAGKPVSHDREFKVVRLGNPMRVPSTGRMNIPQRLIGKAKRLQTSGTLAHFRFTPDVDARINIDAQVYGLPQPALDMVKVGDRVVV